MIGSLSVTVPLIIGAETSAMGFLFFLVLVLSATASVPNANFILSDFGGKGEPYAAWWRGYKFSVKEQIDVTALRGGAANDKFRIAIFPLTGNTLEGPH